MQTIEELLVVAEDALVKYSYYLRRDILHQGKGYVSLDSTSAEIYLFRSIGMKSPILQTWCSSMISSEYMLEMNIKANGIVIQYLILMITIIAMKGRRQLLWMSFY